MKADLHMHSVLSDGGMEIRDLGKYADEIGLDYIAVTDHDTLEHHTILDDELKGLKVKGIKGLEISAYDFSRDRKAHILAYGIKDYEEVNKIIAPMILKRWEGALWMVEMIRKKGYPLTIEHVKSKAKKSTSIYKQHIMQAMMELGYTDGIKKDLYKEFFGKPSLDSKGGFAYKEFEYVDARLAVETVKRAGGIAILAHPAAYKNVDFIPELKECGLDGLEVWHSSQNEVDNKILLELVRKYDCLATGGSDFHGMMEGHINPLGSATLSGSYLDEFLSELASIK